MRLLLLALAALLLFQWSRRQESDFREGTLAEPVVLTMNGPDARQDIEVQRISPNGHVDTVPRLPQRLEWIGGPAWYAGMLVKLPDSVLAGIASLTVSIGDKNFPFTGDELRTGWRAERAQDGMVSLHAPASVRSHHSRLHLFDNVINWPGDRAAVAHAAFCVPSFRLCVVLLLLVLLRIHGAAAPDRRWLVERIAQQGTVLIFVLFACAVLIPVLASRFSFPLSLEHLEGVQATCTSIWAQQGGDLYAIPSIDGSGNIYAPAYYVACRLWGALFGHTLPSLRGLTWACNALSSAAVLSILIRLRARRSVWLWLSLYLSMFCFCSWIDNANKDALHICLSLIGFALLLAAIDPPTRWPRACILGAGVAWSLALMTKQSHLAIVAPVLLVLLIRSPRSFLLLSGCMLACTGALTLVAVRTWSNYWDWTVRIPGSHHFLPSQLADSLVSVAVSLAGFFVLAARWWWLALEPRSGHATAREQEANRTLVQACAAFVVGGIAMGCMSAGKDRGGDYAYLPGLAALCIPVTIVLGTRIRGSFALVCPLLLLVLNWPVAHAVSASDSRAARELIARVERQPGDTWVPLEAFANVAAGKRAFAPLFCVGEWTAAGRPFPASLLDSLRQRRFSLIISQYNWPDRGGYPGDQEPFDAIAQSYELVEVLPRERAYSPKDGWRNVMRLVWRPKPE